MIKILIFGYSNICKRRVIPSLLKNFENIEIDICSKSQKNDYHFKISNWFRNYDIALKKSKANLVYISLYNSLHYKLAKKCLENNFHVIIDKPATLSFEESSDLITIAKKKKKLLSEAVVFNYHQQFKYLIKNLKKDKKIIRIKCNFSIPKLPKNNFRNKTVLGGGCFNDMSPYAASLNRLLINKDFKSENIIFSHNKGKDLNRSFNFKIVCKKILFLGNFSFNSKYKNNLLVETKNNFYNLNRVFSPPSDLSLKISIKNKNTKINKNVFFKKDNIFLNYFKDIFVKLKDKNFKNEYDKIYYDSFFRKKLKNKI